MAGLVLLLTSPGLRAANVLLTGSDATGASSFNASGNWNNGIAPNAANSYATTNYVLRSPADANSYTFGGNSLRIDPYALNGNVGGRFLVKGTGPATLTVTNLILNGGLMDFANAADNATKTFAGNIFLNGNSTNYLGALTSETFLITAPISGGGNLQFGGTNVNANADTSVVAIYGTNTYSGNTTVATGTLLVNGPCTNSSFTVYTNATLGGIGSIGGSVTVQNGGILAPGIATHGTLVNTLGTLTISGNPVGGPALTLTKGALLTLQLSAGLQSDLLQITSGVANSVLFTNNVITFSDLTYGTLSSGSYTLFTAPAASTYSGLTLDSSNFITAGLTIGSGLSGYPTSRLRLVNNTIVLQISTNAPLPAATFPIGVTNSSGVSLIVGSNGVYSVGFAAQSWTFTGSLAQSLSSRTVISGTDVVGTYSEIDFNYTNSAGHAAGIRVYDGLPEVMFLDTTLQAGANDLAFPQWATYPATRSHLTYGASAFAEYSFSSFYSDSPWVFFNTNGDTFIQSAATKYMVASTTRSGGYKEQRY